MPLELVKLSIIELTTLLEQGLSNPELLVSTSNSLVEKYSLLQKAYLEKVELFNADSSSPPLTQRINKLELAVIEQQARIILLMLQIIQAHFYKVFDDTVSLVGSVDGEFLSPPPSPGLPPEPMTFSQMSQGLDDVNLEQGTMHSLASRSNSPAMVDMPDDTEAQFSLSNTL